MAAYKFWRLHISAAKNSTYVAISKLEMAETIGGESVCVGGVASSSSQWSNASADKAFDGSTATEWCSASDFPRDTALALNTGMAYIQYELLTPKDIAEIRITESTRWDVLSNYSPVAFSLYASDDGISWLRIKSWSNQSFTAGETKTYSTIPIPYGQIKNKVHKEIIARSANLMPGIANKANFRGYALYGESLSMPLRATVYTGSKRIVGSTTSLGIRVARRVDLVDQLSGLLVQTIHTGEDGSFEFKDIADRRYSVIGVDNTLEQNSVIFANVTPVD